MYAKSLFGFSSFSALLVPFFFWAKAYFHLIAQMSTKTLGVYSLVNSKFKTTILKISKK